MNTESIFPLSQGVYDKYALLEMQNLIPAQSLQDQFCKVQPPCHGTIAASVTIYYCETHLKPIVLQPLSQ